MKHRFLLIFALPLLIFSCTPSSEKQALELVENSIEAHEVSKNWDEVAAVKFKKWTRLMDENGAIESESEQWVEFRLKPYFEAKLTWTKDSISHVVNFNGSKTSYQMGENSIQNEGFLNAKKSEIDAAYFAFAQPWNLLDENANLSYEGEKTLENGETVESIRMDYASDSGSWWVFFDPSSGKVVGNEQHSKENRNLIETISYDESTGVVFAKDRKSFRIDEAGKKLFLQAEYVYSDYQVTFE